MSKKKKGFDYSVLRYRKTYDILMPLGKFIIRCLYKVKHIGVENVPKENEGGFILASNHLSAPDPMIIATGVKGRQFHFMAKQELYDNPIIKWAFTKVNGFPISRGKGDTEAMEYAVRVPKEGYALGIFPEGTRSRTYVPGRPKMGAARIAFEAKCGVLPVSVYSSDKMKKHTRVTVRFGKMIPYEELGFTSEDKPTKEELRAVSDKIMGEITELWRQGHCSE